MGAVFYFIRKKHRKGYGSCFPFFPENRALAGNPEEKGMVYPL
jgi:hypothetical protein